MQFIFSGKPHNPLVNAGSIIINALLYQLVSPEMSSSEKFDFVQQYFSVSKNVKTLIKNKQ